MTDKELIDKIKEIIQQYEEGLILDLDAVMKIFDLQQEYLNS